LAQGSWWSVACWWQLVVGSSVREREYSSQFQSVSEFINYSENVIREKYYSTLYIARRHRLLPFYCHPSEFIYFRFRLPFVFIRSSTVVRRQPSTVIRSSTVFSSRHPLVLPLYDIDPEVRSSNSIKQVPLQSCRKLCIVLSSAGSKKTPSSPFYTGFELSLKFPFDHFFN